MTVRDNLIAARGFYATELTLYRAASAHHNRGAGIPGALDSLRALQAALPHPMRVLDDFERPRNRSWSRKAGYQIFDRAIAAQDEVAK